MKALAACFELGGNIENPAGEDFVIRIGYDDSITKTQEITLNVPKIHPYFLT